MNICSSNFTVKVLDFNKTFKEQGKILCEIKHMLDNKNNGDNKPFVCNPVISSKLNDRKFQELYENFKRDSNIIKSSSKILSSKKSSTSRITKKSKSLTSSTKQIRKSALLGRSGNY